MLGLGLGLQKSTKLGGFIGLLDLFPGAAAAYSLRKLRAAYSGSAVRVRKEVSAVSSETDIGFLSDGSLDTSTLLTFASDADGGDVFVVTWYDQSLSNDATQSTGANQPKIVSGGSLVTENGKPALDFDGVNDDLTFTDTGTMANGCSSFHVLAADDAAQDSVAFYKVVDTNNTLSMGLRLNVIGARFREGGAETNKGGTSSTNQVLFAQTSDNTPIMTAAIDGVLVTSAASIRLSGVGSSIGSRRGNDYHYDGTMQEIVFFESDQSANRTAIETNINTFYSIYS